MAQSEGWSIDACEAALKQAHNRLGHPPTIEQFNECPGPTAGTVKRVFGSWNDALLHTFGELNRVNLSDIETPDDIKNRGLQTVYRRGYAARLMGEDRNDPYHQDAGLKVVWYRGWDDADSKNEESVFECPRCGDSFDTNMGLHKHHYRTHPDEWQERFWMNVDKGREDDCWIWQGSKTGHGYGQFGLNNENYYAHRLSYRIEYGPIPKPQVNHHCDNPGCVNPNHLYAGTHSDNMQDAYERNKEWRKHTNELEGVLFTSENANQYPVQEGPDNSGAIFTAAQVREIREAYENGEYGTDLAENYGVGEATIYRILNRDTYKNV